MEAKEQREIVTAWNEVEEVLTDLNQIPGKELIQEDVMKCMQDRLAKALDILSNLIEEKYFQEEK